MHYFLNVLSLEKPEDETSSLNMSVLTGAHPTRHQVEIYKNINIYSKPLLSCYDTLPYPRVIGLGGYMRSGQRLVQMVCLGGLLYWGRLVEGRK